jgi:hypothetical protein
VARQSQLVEDVNGQDQQSMGMGRTSQQVVGALVCIALAVVILTPVALSSSDLIRWAQSPAGLGVQGPWPYFVFVGLDCAALVCVGMTIISAWRGESGGAFNLLTWVFAGGSALANWSHGRTTPAPDDEFFFPAMSLAGPLLLDVVLMRVRRWIRTDKQHQLTSGAKFGVRWFVALRETRQAWVISRRDGISEPMVAIAMVRERHALTSRNDEERLRFALMAIPDSSPWELHRWLLERGVEVSQDVLDRAAPAAPPAVSVSLEQRAIIDQVEEPLPISSTAAPIPIEPGAINPDAADPIADDAGPAADGAPRPPEPSAGDQREPEDSTVSRRTRRTAVTELSAADLLGLSDEELRAQVAGQTKRGRARLALEVNDDDVPASHEWLRRLGFEGADLPDKSEMYKVRTSRTEESARARRSNVRALSSGQQS